MNKSNGIKLTNGEIIKEVEDEGYTREGKEKQKRKTDKVKRKK